MKKTKKLDVSEYNGFFDIQYSSVSKSCLLDIFVPNGEGPFPVIVSIHGGAFKKCDKRDFEMISDMLFGLDKGYAVVGVNYRLSGEAQFPEPVKDIKQAIRYIIDHSKEYNLDPDKIVVWGGSAGGYFAVMSGMIHSISLFDDVYSSQTVPRISGVIAWFPPIDFLNMDNELREIGLLNTYPDHESEESPESLFLGEPILKSHEKINQSNPENYISEDMAPMFIQHGKADRIVPYKQSENFIKTVIKKLGNRDKIKHEFFEGAGHGDKKFSEASNLIEIYQFIEQCFENENIHKDKGG